ncbi:hypothetical protein EBZ37_06405 [bacterium]|nr:hypothetical protein [bacterium]
MKAEWNSKLPLPALVSRNHLKEESLDSEGKVTQVREYDRTYWIREKSRQGTSAEIILGGGENSSVNPSSAGSYDSLNQMMLIQQDLGQGTRVHSRSDLSQPGLTLYQEIFWFNGRKKTFSEIRYIFEP